VTKNAPDGSPVEEDELQKDGKNRGKQWKIL